MRECSNYFMYEKYFGDFSIIDNVLDVDVSTDFFLINGSKYNDGVHQDNENLFDESFSGYVVILNPPKLFQELSDEIEKFNDENPMSNLQSESIPNYSYSLVTNSDGAQGWQSVYSSRLKPFKLLPTTLSSKILRCSDGN